MDERTLNFIFVLIVGFVPDGRGYINPSSNLKNVWDYQPGVDFFRAYFEKTP